MTTHTDEVKAGYVSVAREPSIEKLSDVAKSIGNTASNPNYLERAKRCWAAMISPENNEQVPQGIEALATANGVAGDVVEGLKGNGYVYHNPDIGFEYSRTHPVESGECSDALDIRSSTIMEDLFDEHVQELFTKLNVKGAEGSAERAIKNLRMIAANDGNADQETAKRALFIIGQAVALHGDVLPAEGSGNAEKHVCVYCHSEFLSGEMLAAHLAEVDATNSPGSGNAGLRELLSAIEESRIANPDLWEQFETVRLSDAIRKAYGEQLPASIPAPVVDTREIALRCLQRMKDSGESYVMCARWISAEIDEALHILPSAVTADAEAVVLCKRLHIFQIEDEDYIYLTFRGNRITRAKKNSVEASHILRLEADLRSALPPTDRDGE